MMSKNCTWFVEVTFKFKRFSEKAEEADKEDN